MKPLSLLLFLMCCISASAQPIMRQQFTTNTGPTFSGSTTISNSADIFAGSTMKFWNGAGQSWMGMSGGTGAINVDSGILFTLSGAGYFSGKGTGLSAIPGSAINADSLPFTSLAQDVYGLLTNNFSGSNALNNAGWQLGTNGNGSFSGTVSAAGFSGDGSALTGLASGFTNTITSTITFGSTITPSLTIGGLTTKCPRRITFRLAMTGNVTTVAAPTGTAVDGDTMVWEVSQDGTGNRTIAGFNATYGFGTDITGITLTTNANARDFITFAYNSAATAKWSVLGVMRGYPQ